MQAVNVPKLLRCHIKYLQQNMGAEEALEGKTAFHQTEARLDRKRQPVVHEEEHPDSANPRHRPPDGTAAVIAQERSEGSPKVGAQNRPRKIERENTARHRLDTGHRDVPARRRGSPVVNIEVRADVQGKPLKGPHHRAPVKDPARRLIDGREPRSHGEEYRRRRGRVRGHRRSGGGRTVGSGRGRRRELRGGSDLLNRSLLLDERRRCPAKKPREKGQQ